MATALMVEIDDGMAGSFGDYMEKFGRTYAVGSEEYDIRRSAFGSRLDYITKHNSNPERLWDAGLNHLSDLTHEEYTMRLGWRPAGRVDMVGTASFMELQSQSNEELADEVDWTTLNMSRIVPDQSSCGSCWALATVSMMDAHSEIHRGEKAHAFSPQQLVDCVPNPRECGGQGGCKGSTVELAMKYIQKMGLDDDSLVPYQASDGNCTKPADAAFAATFLEMSSGESMRPHRHSRRTYLRADDIGLKSWVTLPSNQAGPLMKALLDGPVAVSVGADSWHSYFNGVFDKCAKDVVINHAVTMFGYGQANGTNYWSIRNSWGSGWGENGYIRLLRGNTTEEDSANCGIDHEPDKGIECKPYPDTVKVCGMCGILYDSVAVTFNKA